MFLVDGNSSAARRMVWPLALAVSVLVSPLAGCSEGAAPERPWRAYATNPEANRFEWLSSYATRSDCLATTKHIIEKYQGYRAPYGCLYGGYQNAYVQWVVNWFLEPDAFRCIIRNVDSASHKAGRFYEPVLTSKSSDDDWYCYLKN